MIIRRLVCVSLLTAACATPMSGLRDDNRRLTQTVAELRADRRAQDHKLRDLEHQLALAKERAPGDPAMPQLPVEVIGPPPGARDTSAPDRRVVSSNDDSVEIVYEGDAATGKPATLDDDATPRRAAPASAPRPKPEPPALADIPTSSDRLEVTHHAARPPRTPLRTAAVHGREREPADTAAVTEYRAAVELVKTGKHDDAIPALRAFLAHHPRHDYADNAQYWIGEAFYARKDYAHALIEFRATIETYPRGNKVPDALLKVGYCYLALGQKDKARAVLEQVVNLYPRSEPAALATKRLGSS